MYFFIFAFDKNCHFNEDETFSNKEDETFEGFRKRALDHLGDIVGETTKEDVLDMIFERFCIGK